MTPFDVAPYALSRCPPGEFWFETPRDIRAMEIRFRRHPPSRVAIHYRQHGWPRLVFEPNRARLNPIAYGWQPTDDGFNGEWRQAGIIRSIRGRTVRVAFQPLKADHLPDFKPTYNPVYRRTMAIRIVTPDPDAIVSVRLFTTSAPARSTARVEFDAGRHTPGRTLRLSAYNATVKAIRPETGVRIRDGHLVLNGKGRRSFSVTVDHMATPTPYTGDDGLLTFQLESETFTIRLQDLEDTGPVWFADQGVYVTSGTRPEPFAAYRARHAGAMTNLQRVKQQDEATFGTPFFQQPRGHAVNFNVGCKHSPQRYWLEANGDIVLIRGNLDFMGRRPDLAKGYLNQGDARFFFGLESWVTAARCYDPSSAPIYTMVLRKGGLLLEQQVLAAPVRRSVLKGELTFDEPVACLVQFTFRNEGHTPVHAELPLGYSHRSRRQAYNLIRRGYGYDDYRVPTSVRDGVTLKQGRMTTRYKRKPVLRAMYETTMKPAAMARGATLVRTLKPGDSCFVRLKIPFVRLDSKDLRSLATLSFARCKREAIRFWRDELAAGSRLRTPNPHLDAVHDAHLTHVEISDFAMPDDPRRVSTSVGTSTYGNFINESVMIIQELDQRGLTDAVRRRLEVFLKYQGTAQQPGNFTDFEGSLFGAGGWECGDYNQHHGWALWYLAEHFLMTRDRSWLAGVADAMIRAADWVFRQRRNTLTDQPHSRGWERGFLPAGSLEDVRDFQYWLSTNSLTWRGTDAAARALEAAGHPEAARVRRESDAYGRDLRRGFTLSRQQAPLVPLRDGRWVPHFPSRLYCRGREVGWIREVLEGSVYLLISGLYDPRSREADWILNDYQDNLYNDAPFGYVQRDPWEMLLARGGFSMQPNLLAGLMPHLDRDEPEVYLWMFFNAWVSCYREEIAGMIEHPMPELGFANAATFKTSDEANAVMWLHRMLVYGTDYYLHLGRAIPRAWLKAGETVEITKVRTRWGTVSARWTSAADQGRITLDARLQGPQDAPQTLARFRHPESAVIRRVTVNGTSWKRFDPVKGDVDITGLKGSVRMIVRY